MFMKAGDAISGQEGTAFVTINGEVHEAFYVKSLEATVEKNKVEFKALGKRGVQNKATGWSGTGSMTIYYATSIFRKLMLEYIKTGKDTYFDIQITNDDPSSSIGKQTVTLINVNLDSVIMAKLDTESDILDEDADFTFDDVEMAEDAQFRTPELG